MRFSARWLMALSLLSLVAGSVPVQSVQAEDGEDGGHKGFIVSFDDAKTQATGDKKDIFMEFTGSDWCPPCKALYKNVLSTEEFLGQAPENFVLLMIDNPRDKSKQSQEVQDQNQKLISEYKISGFPTIILADAQGRPYARMVGYSNTGSADYLKQLKEKVVIRENRDANFAKAANAEGAEKAKFLGEAIKEIDPELAVQIYRPEIDQIIELDSDNATGMKETFIGIIKSSEVREQLNAIRSSLRGPDDIDAALAKFDDLIDSSEPGPELHQEILFMKAQLLFGKDKAKSKETLLAAEKLAPESDMAGQIKSILSQYFSDDEAKEEK
jgi:thioredoxin-related protein